MSTTTYDDRFQKILYPFANIRKDQLFFVRVCFCYPELSDDFSAEVEKGGNESLLSYRWKLDVAWCVERREKSKPTAPDREN